MHILIAVHGFPPTHYAGAERNAERIAKWLVEHGHEVDIFTIESLSSPGFEMQSSCQDDFMVHRLFYDIKDDPTLFEHSYNHPKIGEAFRQILQERKIDVVHVISGYLLGGQVINTAHAFGIPVVITLTEYWYLCTRLNLLKSDDSLCVGPESDHKCAQCMTGDKRRFKLASRIAPQAMTLYWDVAHKLGVDTLATERIEKRREILSEALNSADVVISPSHFLISKYKEFGLDTSQYVFIRHGIEDRGNPPPALNESNPKGLRVGYLGQVKEHKGVDIAHEAVAQLIEEGQDVALDIWGPDDEDAKFVSKMRQRSAQLEGIHWRGRYSGNQLTSILSSFDVIVVPSRWYENCPTVILEAQRAGVPVIATNLGGMAELVDDGVDGLLFTLNDVDDLKTQIRKLLENPDLLPYFRANTPYVKSPDEEVAEIFAQYERLVQKT